MSSVTRPLEPLPLSPPNHYNALFPEFASGLSWTGQNAGANLFHAAENFDSDS